VYNSVFTRFAEGVRLDNDGLIYFTNGPAGTWNTVWDVATSANANGQFLFTRAGLTNKVEDPLLGGVSYTNNLGLNPRPLAGSPALSNVLPGAPVTVAYRGAFAPNGNWADGWTALSREGYLAPAQQGQTFDGWAASENLPPGQSGQSDDPDADGVLNVVEFALGADPTGDSGANVPSGLTLDIGGQAYPAVTFTRSKSVLGVQIQVEAASDIDFQIVLSVVTELPVDLGNGTERVTVRTAAPAGATTFFHTTVLAQ
jgi:hypothetical protein